MTAERQNASSTDSPSPAFLPDDELPLRGIKVLELSHMIWARPAGWCWPTSGQR